MNARQLYGQAAASAWTRIDMLLKLYAAAVDTADRGVQQIQASGRVESDTRIRMQRIIGQLIDGLDLSQGDVPAQVQSLLLFSLKSTGGNDEREWASMSRVLSTLHEGFSAIRPEAIAAERKGEVPPLAGQSRRETLSLHG